MNNDKKDLKEKLKKAVSEERTASERALKIYDQLAAKMQSYQMGTGPAPTREDFAKWSEAVEYRIKMKQLAINVDGEVPRN